MREEVRKVDGGGLVSHHLLGESMMIATMARQVSVLRQAEGGQRWT